DLLPRSIHESPVLLATPDRSGLRPSFPARPIGCSAFRPWSASLALPTAWPTMPSADSCAAVRSPRGALSSEFGTRLAKLVRGKLRAILRRRRPDLVLPQAAWRKPWVVHITSWGVAEQAVLDYLARYVFRVAITNARLVTLDDQAVTIRYKQRKSSAWLTCRITGDEFMRRF